MIGATVILQEQPNGDLLYICKRKGSNPDRKKYPMLKCPLCKKNLHPVFNVSVKNNAILFDIDDPRYRDFPRNHICKCAGCHHTIGVHYKSLKERQL